MDDTGGCCQFASSVPLLGKQNQGRGAFAAAWSPESTRKKKGEAEGLVFPAPLAVGTGQRDRAARERLSVCSCVA
jgi:hypothetical protein